MKTIPAVMALAMLIPAQASAQEFDLAKADTHDRVTYHRLIDAAVWAMPLTCFKFWRDSSMPLTNLAIVLGYTDVSAFSCAFKQQFGQSPSEWRKQYK